MIENTVQLMPMELSYCLQAKRVSLLKILLMALFAIALLGRMEPVRAQTGEEIARAYVQAIVDGAGSKVAGSIDFGQRKCVPAKVFGAECQAAVLNNKDGKTYLMEAITSVSSNEDWSQSNIKTLIPEADLKRVFSDLNDSKFNETRDLLYSLSTHSNGSYSYLEGTGKAKVILQRYIESIGNGGMYGQFVWPFDKADASQAKLTEAGIKIKIKKVPLQSDLRDDVVYYWALQTNFSDMAYPAGFIYPQIPGKPAGHCQNTTTAWGHIGWQYTSTKKLVNWGGGGNGNGNGDYGCGGSYTTEEAWDTAVYYDYKVKRGTQRGPKLWDWIGTITKTGGKVVYEYTIYGGEYITDVMVWSELLNVKCADPAISVEWSEPYVRNSDGKFRVGRIDRTFTNDGCMRSMQKTVSASPLAWTQDQGSVSQPAPHAQASELRTKNNERLTETYYLRPANPTGFRPLPPEIVNEIAIACAYVQAISDGPGQKSVSDAVHFVRNGCTTQTVWQNDKCQAAVLNGKDGKTILMEAISPVMRGADWGSSNIRYLIPEADMRRIMTDPRYKNAKDIFSNMSTPNNGWYPWFDGDGKAKDILRHYMDVYLTEIAIARAYVQAISDGSGPKAVSDAVDFVRNGCTAQTVWQNDKCQAAVFNGKDGKTILMEAISPVARGVDWSSSSIKNLIPEADMRRIMTDPRYKNARDIFSNMSTPNNGWYPWLDGEGRAKYILRRYMDASR